ncbi:hypothetical protein H0H92_015937, partial [Tricholoma furcatifolium]
IVTLVDVFISPTYDMFVHLFAFAPFAPRLINFIGIRLHTLLLLRTLEKDLIRNLLYQLLTGIHFIHSCGVVHRNLNPLSIRVDNNNVLKICDLGVTEIQDILPELIMQHRKYNFTADIWSVGCILFEMVEGKPLFHDDITAHTCEMNLLQRKHIQRFNQRDYVDGVSTHFTCLDPICITPIANIALDLLQNMIIFDPRNRIDTNQALAHGFIKLHRNSTDEPVADEKIDWKSLYVGITDDLWDVFVGMEILDFHQIQLPLTDGETENQGMEYVNSDAECVYESLSLPSEAYVLADDPSVVCK